MKGKAKKLSWLTFLRIFLILAGLFFVLSSFETVSVIESSRHWPVVKGQVFSSEVERRPVFWALTGGEECLGRIWFSYAVDGKKYVSQNFRFDQAFSSNCAAAEELVKQYPAGKAIDVFYSSTAPDMAVIDSSHPPLLDFVLLGIGILVVLVGGVALLGGEGGGVKQNDAV